MPVRGPVPQSSKSSKDVNNLLHTLRGEHFRRTLNTQRTSRLGTTHLTPQLVGRSLPYAEIYGLRPDRSSSRALGADAKVTRTTAAGPIPRSWAAAASTAPPAVKVSESAWRATALSLFFYYAQNGSDYTSSHWHPTSLAKCCLRVLLEHCHDCHCAAVDADVDADADDGGVTTALEELASFLAPHHRKEAVRMCAVWSPLSGARLRALLGEGRNHVEGELVVVQPASPLRPEMFFRTRKTQTQTQTYAIRVNDRQQRQHQYESGSEEPSSWQQWDDDAETDEARVADPDHSGRSTVTVTDAGSDWQEQEDEDEQVFTAVAIVSTTLSILVLLALPSSLTRLALVHLSAPIPIHRLPDKCPLLELLDISYNPWLAEPAWGVERTLERVEWGRWAYLKVLGCRDCGITLEELRTVNEGRWEDVRIVT